jgi:hypothetical protein
MTGRCTRVVPVLLLGVLLFAACAFAAAPPQSPPKETLKYGDTELLVERTATATEKDLLLPFYAGAKLREGHTYRVTTKQDGKQLSYLASATLTTRDKADKVAQDYSRKLPGKPQPTTLQDKRGKRIVLAVASKEEVRTVTILPGKRGCEIQLTRALKHGPAPPLPTPELAKPRPQFGPEGGRGRGGGRRGPGPRPGPGGRGGMKA